MEIKNRLIRIITSEGLTSAAFADSIGVQRSSISHIISGRNKPSLDFLQKILLSFPKYNAEWLITGKGDIYKPPTQSSLFVDTPNENKAESVMVADIKEESQAPIASNSVNEALHSLQIDAEIGDRTTTETNLNSFTKEPILKPKKIQKIVMFYDDKTCSEYFPE